MSDDALDQENRLNRARKEVASSTVPSKHITVPIDGVGDIVTARQRGRELALQIGFPQTDATLIATAISELTRNIVLYAKHGELTLAAVKNELRKGIHIVAYDDGPGIPDLQRALVGGYSTSGGLGLGLSGVKRLVDEFEVDTEPGRGTRVAATKWLL